VDKTLTLFYAYWTIHGQTNSRTGHVSLSSVLAILGMYLFFSFFRQLVSKFLHLFSHPSSFFFQGVNFCYCPLTAFCAFSFVWPSLYNCNTSVHCTGWPLQLQWIKRVIIASAITWFSLHTNTAHQFACPWWTGCNAFCYSLTFSWIASFTALNLCCGIGCLPFSFDACPLICFVTSYCMCNTTFRLSACCILDPSHRLAYIGNLLLPGISIFCCFQPVITKLRL